MNCDTGARLLGSASRGMPRVRTTRALAQRIDLTYFKRPHPLRTARTALVVLCCAAALIWWAVAGTRGHHQMYSPGPLWAVHAMGAERCEVCHDGNGKGRFLRSVSDAACLRCHDGSIHHPNQLRLIATGADGQAHAAQCSTCHIEHRGHDALIGASDLHCLQCHADLSAHSRRPPRVQSRVTAFDTADHPHFGRSLTPRGQPVDPAHWVDPTVLWFNHKVHMSKVPPPAGLAENCTKCHVPLRTAEATTQPAPGDYAGDGRYMQPVSYMASCSASDCHPISMRSLRPDLSPLVAEGSLPHADLDTVRSAVERYLRSALAAGKFQGPSAAPAPAGASRLPGRRPAPRPAGKQDISKAEWVRQNARFLLDRINSDRPPSFPRYAGAIPDIDSIPAAGEPPAIGDSSLVDLYVAYVALNQCNKCHRVEGDFPSLTAGPVGRPLRTSPTGISTSPRRWFVHSTFDHRSHRNLSCTSCHARAPESEKTSDVLSPDIAWTGSHSARVSCTDCHHKPFAGSLGAASNCITCHVFHDRSEEPAAGPAERLSHE